MKNTPLSATVLLFAILVLCINRAQANCPKNCTERWRACPSNCRPSRTCALRVRRPVRTCRRGRCQVLPRDIRVPGWTCQPVGCPSRCQTRIPNCAATRCRRVRCLRVNGRPRWRCEQLPSRSASTGSGCTTTEPNCQRGAIAVRCSSGIGGAPSYRCDSSSMGIPFNPAEELRLLPQPSVEAEADVPEQGC